MWSLTILALNQGDQGWQDIINNLKEKTLKTWFKSANTKPLSTTIYAFSPLTESLIKGVKRKSTAKFTLDLKSA